MSWMLGYSNVLNIYSSYISYGLIMFVYKLECRAFLHFSLPIFWMLEIVYEGFWVFMGIFKCANTYALTWSVCVCVSLCEDAGAYGSQKSTSGCLPWSHFLRTGLLLNLVLTILTVLTVQQPCGINLSWPSQCWHAPPFLIFCMDAGNWI